jgi:hypothetical protein
MKIRGCPSVIADDQVKRGHDERGILSLRECF